MRKSASVLMPSRERMVTLPPSPPSPPSGPPNGTNFSRRKLTQPRPPFPAATLILASSTNFMVVIGFLHQQKTRRLAGFFARTGSRFLLVHLLGVDTDEGVAFRALLRELDLAVLEREQRMVGADTHVGARAHRGAALADQDVAGEYALAAELLHAQTLAV